jgi:hypothetical protein
MAFTIVGDAALVSGDCFNSRKAAVFTGGDTDDAYTMDALAAARTAANDTVGTITAWVCPGDITSTMSIVCFSDNNVVEFIDFNIAAGKLGCNCTDATVAQFVAISDNVVCPAHKWTHVAVRQSASEGIKLFVDGVKVASTNSTATDIYEWFTGLDGVDVGTIGAGRIGGAGAYTQEFVGGISDVKYYNTALTDEDIMNDYEGTHLATGCIAWYQMDSLLDSATGAGTYSLTAVSDVYMTPTYNEFISRVRKFGAVTADAAGFCENQGRMSVMFINAA